MKGAIFDLDGVLVDTAKYHYLAWKSLADELGIPFNEQDNERLKGVSRMASLEIVLSLGDKKDYTEAEKNALAAVKNERYVAFISKTDENELLKGAKEYLIALKNKGIKIALGSASKNAGIILKSTGIEGLFDFVADGNNVSRAKPDPEVFLVAAKGLSLEPCKCVVFEDSLAGITAAKKGGMTAVAIGKPENLTGADYIINGLYEAPLDLFD